MSIVIDAIVGLLPQDNIGLKPVNATHYDAMLDRAWQQNGIVGFHMQDKRLSAAERAVLCHLANKVRGRRIV